MAALNDIGGWDFPPGRTELSPDTENFRRVLSLSNFYLLCAKRNIHLGGLNMAAFYLSPILDYSAG